MLLGSFDYFETAPSRMEFVFDQPSFLGAGDGELFQQNILHQSAPLFEPKHLPYFAMNFSDLFLLCILQAQSLQQ